jgi:hypothetical protein
VRPFSSKGDIRSDSHIGGTALLRLGWRCPSQVRQVEAEVLCLLDSGVEREETEPADHVVRAITARDRISATMAR